MTSSGRIVYTNAGEKFFVGDAEVTREEFDARFPTKAVAGGSPLLPFHTPACWPMLSEGAAVHPSQVAEATEHAKKLGVPTEYLPTGEPVLTSREHRKKFNKAHGLVDKNGGYGD